MLRASLLCLLQFASPLHLPPLPPSTVLLIAFCPLFHHTLTTALHLTYTVCSDIDDRKALMVIVT